jgi:hypothetical protein
MDSHSFFKLDPDPDPHLSKKLDPDPHKVNADPKASKIACRCITNRSYCRWRRVKCANLHCKTMDVVFIIDQG